MEFFGRDLGPTYDYHPTGRLQQGRTMNTGQSSEAGNSRLEALPNEVLAAILEKLTIWRQHWSDVAEFKLYDPRWPDTQNKRAACLADFQTLCLVSKRMDLIARPYLFRKIPLESSRILIKLFRTLVRAEHLANNIKEVSFDLDFLLGIRPLSSAGRRDLYQDMSQNGLGPSNELIDSSDSQIICLLFYAIIARASNLRSLDIYVWGQYNRMERFDPQHFHQVWSGRQPENISTFSARVGNAARAAAQGLAPAFLPKLETLTLWGLKDSSLAVGLLGDFLAISSLKSIDSRNDDGNWCHLAPRAELYETLPNSLGERRPHRNITTLALSRSSTCLYDIEDIAQLFPCLRSLSITGTVHHSKPGRLEHYMDQGSRRDLSQALAKMTFLRNLEINLYPFFDIIIDAVYPAITASFGRGHTLSLALLRDLEQVEVPSYMFANMGLHGVGESAAVPRMALPRSLKRLVLLALCHCGNRHEREPCWDSIASTLEFLESLRDDLHHFPQLETVTYCFTKDICGNPFWHLATPGGEGHEEEDNRSYYRLSEIRDAFSRKNVQFVLQIQLEPCRGTRRTKVVLGELEDGTQGDEPL